MTSETIDAEDRVRRAQNEEMEAHVVRQDPLVVEVDNESSDSTHAVLPDALYCDCEDHRYRGAVCKHMIFLANREDWIAEAVRQALTDQLTELQSEEMHLRDRLRSISQERDQIETVRSSLDVVLSYDGPPEGHPRNPWGSDDIEEALEDADIDAEEIVEEIESDEDDGDDEFRSMVEDLRTE